MKSVAAVTLLMSTVNDNFSEYAPCVVLFITQECIDKLLSMQAVVIDTGATTMTFSANFAIPVGFKYLDEETEGKMDAAFPGGVITGIDNIDKAAFIATEVSDDDSSLRMDVTTIVVKNNSFRLSAVPKFCGDDVKCHSEDFYIVNGEITKTMPF